MGVCFCPGGAGAIDADGGGRGEVPAEAGPGDAGGAELARRLVQAARGSAQQSHGGRQEGGGGRRRDSISVMDVW